MAILMVDYENVLGTNGLKGVEYLTSKDVLYIFYSQCCGKIRAEYMEAIQNSNCDFFIYKLTNTGKNALADMAHGNGNRIEGRTLSRNNASAGLSDILLYLGII